MQPTLLLNRKGSIRVPATAAIPDVQVSTSHYQRWTIKLERCSARLGVTTPITVDGSLTSGPTKHGGCLMLGSILEGRAKRLLDVGIVGGASMGVVMLVMRCVPDWQYPGHSTTTHYALSPTHAPRWAVTAFDGRLCPARSGTPVPRENRICGTRSHTRVKSLVHKALRP